MFSSEEPLLKAKRQLLHGKSTGRDAACPMHIPGGHVLLSSSLAEKFPPLFGKSQCQEEGSGFLSRNVHACHQLCASTGRVPFMRGVFVQS